MSRTRRQERPRADRIPTPPFIRRGVPLAPYTTFGIGGPARFFAAPACRSQLLAALRWALRSGVPFFVMGGGANVLVHDRGYEGLVVLTTGLDRVVFRDGIVLAQCGVSVDRLADRCAGRGLSGLEFAGGLPGTLGGALFMNARAYGGEFSRVVEGVDALETAGGEVRARVLEREELGFSYKKSLFQEGEVYVYRARLRLVPGDPGEIGRCTDENRARRREAGQYRFPNAGCVFKNDYRSGEPAGMIIDRLGLKGTRIGGAEVYAGHGNFIVNRGGARAADVFHLMRLVEETVRRERGVLLEREIQLLGDWEEEYSDEEGHPACG
ncbi:MAG: UDP-N-acetylmuramate dehydrogenase [Spirochaetota bacterium]